MEQQEVQPLCHADGSRPDPGEMVAALGARAGTQQETVQLSPPRLWLL